MLLELHRGKWVDHGLRHVEILFARRGSGTLYGGGRVWIYSMVLDMIGSSVKVRNVARRDYVETARKEKGLRISLGDIQRTLQKEGFPPGHLRQIRTSLESRLFWEPVGLRLISSRGQPDRVGTVLEFSFVDL